MNKPAVLFLNSNQFGHSSGHYFYCKYLRDRYSIKYICFDRGLKRISLEGVDVLYVPFTSRKLNRMSNFLSTCISESRKYKPEILFVTYFNLSFLIAIFCKSKKKILDIRTGSLYPERVIRTFQNLLILFQSFFFNKIVILSESLRVRLKIPIKKSTVIPLGSDILFSGDHEFSSLNMLYIGSLDDRHITETIIGLGLYLNANREDNLMINYTIIGFGTEDEINKLRNCIYETDLIDKVRFEGRKTTNELIPYFEKSNIGVVYIPQTEWYDCQPATKIYEYLLSGMPVIATNTYENRLVVNNSNGVLIDDSPEGFSKGLKELVNKKNTFNPMEIRHSMREYTWENIVSFKLKIVLEKLTR